MVYHWKCCYSLPEKRFCCGKKFITVGGNFSLQENIFTLGEKLKTTLLVFKPEFVCILFTRDLYKFKIVYKKIGWYCWLFQNKIFADDLEKISFKVKDQVTVVSKKLLRFHKCFQYFFLFEYYTTSYVFTHFIEIRIILTIAFFYRVQ